MSKEYGQLVCKVRNCTIIGATLDDGILVLDEFTVIPTERFDAIIKALRWADRYVNYSRDCNQDEWECERAIEAALDGIWLVTDDPKPATRET